LIPVAPGIAAKLEAEIVLLSARPAFYSDVRADQ
jgi:hypothetical protein